jgi:hypothetical protein
MRTLSTSVIVSFSGASLGVGDEIFSAEVDSRDDGYNYGKSSFLKGDSPVILLFASPTVVLTKVLQSEGAYSSLGAGVYVVEDDVTFANTREASLAKPYVSGMQIVSAMPAIPDWVVSGNNLLVPHNIVAAASIRYNSSFTAYRITNVSGDYPVVVYFEGVAP